MQHLFFCTSIATSISKASSLFFIGMPSRRRTPHAHHLRASNSRLISRKITFSCQATQIAVSMRCDITAEMLLSLRRTERATALAARHGKSCALTYSCYTGFYFMKLAGSMMHFAEARHRFHIRLHQIFGALSLQHFDNARISRIMRPPA